MLVKQKKQVITYSEINTTKEVNMAKTSKAKSNIDLEKLAKGFTRQGDYIKYQKLVKEADSEKTISVYGKSYQECFKKFDEAEKTWRDSVRLGRDTKIGHVKLVDGMTAYYNKHNKINHNLTAIKESSHSTNLRVIKNQIGKFPIGNKYSDKITAKDLQAHIEELVKQGYAESTVKKAKDCLRVYFNDLYGGGANPATNLTLPRTEREKSCSESVELDQILDDMEIIKFLGECDKAYIPRHRGTKYADLLKFQFYTYSRIGETCALQVQDYTVLDGSGYISIKKNLSRAGKRWYIDTPKNKSSVRTVKLCKEAQAIIEKRISGKKPTDLIWSQSNGDFVKYTTLENPLKKIIKNTGCMKKFSVHSLRHTGISFALRHGASVSAVSKNAGHSSIAITQKIYQHILQSERDEAVDITANALNEVYQKYQQKEKVAS